MFPAMRDIAGATELITDLISEHRELERLAAQLSPTAGAQSVDALGKFADLLEAHIRKEERVLFPLYEKEVEAETAEEVGRAVKTIVGYALKPRDPGLLE
jgi:hemerythrin-like domain-containing protein